MRGVARSVSPLYRTTHLNHLTPLTEVPMPAKQKKAPTKLSLAARLAALEAKVQHDCPEAPKKKGRAVLVTTAHRGVFFGYADKTDGETIALTASRLVVYWSADVKGFMGLAATGPTAGCRIGPAADITLRNITSVTEVTEAAERAFASAPWKQ